MLDRKIDLAAWYPIGIFCELIDFDWDVAGHGQPSYLERQGSVTADRLFSSGTYQQLEFAERSGKVETVRSLERQSKLISTITCALYSFLTFEVTIQPSALRIVYRNASAFGDALIHTTVGFMNQINHRQGSKRRWSGRRISRDEVQFDMELPARFTEAG
jgi:hypothetical protein